MASLVASIATRLPKGSEKNFGSQIGGSAGLEEERVTVPEFSALSTKMTMVASGCAVLGEVSCSLLAELRSISYRGTVGCDKCRCLSSGRALNSSLL